MFPIQDQVSVATRRHLDAQLAIFLGLSDKALDGVDAITTLNISAIKAAMKGSADAAHEAAAAQSPQQLAMLLTTQAQPAFDKTLAYSRHLFGIGAGLRAEFSQALDAQVNFCSRQFVSAMQDAARKGPAGSSDIASLLQSLVENGGKAFEQFQRSAQLAGEAVEANLGAAMSAQAAAA